MKILTRILLISAVLAGGMLLAAPSAQAATPGVKDQAGFFSKEAVTKANGVIHEIQSRFHKEVVVETMLSVPEEDKDEVKDKAGRDRFFPRWARERAADLKVNGIYIVITKVPGHVQVEVGNET